MMSYESLIAIRNIAQKQVNDLNKLIDELCKPVKITDRNNNTYVIDTIYHTCYPAEIKIADGFCNSLCGILTDNESYYRMFIDEPSKISSVYNHLALLRNARILYKITTSDDEKKRLAKIIDTVVAKLPGLLKAYNAGTDYSSTELDVLYEFFNGMGRSYSDIVKQITILQFAGTHGMDCKQLEQELHKLIVEWIAEGDNKILLGGYE